MPSKRKKRASAGGRLGVAGYVAVLNRLRRAATIAEIVDAGIACNSTCRRVVPAMHALGLVRVSGWTTEYDKPYRPVYRTGAGTDAPPPSVRPCGRPVNRPVRAPKPAKIPPELLALAAALTALQAPITQDDIAEESGISVATVRRLLRALRKVRMAFIADWAGRAPLHQLGTNRDDQPKPPPKPREVVQRESRARRQMLEQGQLLPMASVFALASNTEMQAAA